MVASIDFDEEDLRIRALEGCWTPFMPIEKVSPEVFSSVSSISACEDKTNNRPKHRPSLQQPRNVMIDLLSAHMKTEDLTARSTQIFHDNVQQSLSTINQLSKEKEEALEKEAKAAQSRSTWSAYSTAAQYITGVGSVLAGATMGGGIGFLLSVAGIAGVSQRILQDTHLLQTAVEWYTQSKELQNKITQNIEMGAFFLQMGLGLAAGVAAASSLSALDSIQKLSRTVQNAGGVMSVGARFGADFHNKRSSELKARIKELDGQSTVLNQTILQKTTSVNQHLEQTQSLVEEMRKALHNINVSQD